MSKKNLPEFYLQELATLVTNPPQMGGRLPELNSISRLPSDAALEISYIWEIPTLDTLSRLLIQHNST